MKRTVTLVLCSALLALVPGCGSAPKAAGAAATGSYAFWPTFPDDPHVQFVRSFNTSDDVTPQQASGLEKLVFGKELEKGAAINKPYGVAMRDGKIYVCDIRNNCLVVMDLRKKQTRLVGVSGANQLKIPVAVAVGDDATIYVADIGRGAVLVFDSAERYSRAYGHPNLKPSSLAVHGNRLYIADQTGHCVEVLDTASGKQLGIIGSVGEEDGQFRLPLGVATDRQGNVYVMDMMRCRLQKFTPEGRFVGAVGAMGKVAGTFARPKHIAVDGDGVVYAIDAAFQNVQMFDEKFEFLMHFGAAGDYPGAMNLPAGICISDDPRDVELFKGQIHPGFSPKRVIVVSNQFGDDKILLYVEGGLREGFTAQDLAKAAIAVTPGTGKASAEELKMQAPGSEEPASPPAPPGVGAPSAEPPPAPPKETGAPAKSPEPK